MSTVIIETDRIFVWGVRTVQQARERYPEIGPVTIYGAVLLDNGYLVLITDQGLAKRVL